MSPSKSSSVAVVVVGAVVVTVASYAPAGVYGIKELEQFAAFPPPLHNTVCPARSRVTIIEGAGKYHSDASCDRIAFNSYQKSLARSTLYNVFKTQGTVQHVPNEETIVCPMEPKADDTLFKKQNGFETTWIVENSATTPIVLSAYNDDGIEVSAKNSNILPAALDPDAILQPGQWTSISTYEGQTIYARSITIATGVVGPILLQHRAGLVPIGSKNGQELQCSTEDIEPRHPETNTILQEYSRTRAKELRSCNTLDVGFRNVINCPLNAYYIRKDGSTNECSEQFKFHLGTQQSGLQDFRYDWESSTKYEGTYIGHSFNFRLASNPEVIVDTITFQPTYVRDCPDTGIAVPISIAGDIIGIPTTIARTIPDATSTNNTTTIAAGLTYNPTNATTTMNADAAAAAAASRRGHTAGADLLFSSFGGTSSF